MPVQVRRLSKSVVVPSMFAIVPVQVHRENVADTVSRRTIIDHEGVGTTTDKKDIGLENWHWPHTRTYMKCDGDRLYLGRRAYTRVAR